QATADTLDVLLYSCPSNSPCVFVMNSLPVLVNDGPSVDRRGRSDASPSLARPARSVPAILAYETTTRRPLVTGRRNVSGLAFGAPMIVNPDISSVALLVHLESAALILALALHEFG